MSEFEMDFMDFDSTEDLKLVPDSFESCMAIVRATAHVHCNGDIPNDPGKRLALLFASIAQLTLRMNNAIEQAMKDEDAAANEEDLRRSADMGLNWLIAAAACWAQAIMPSNHVESYAD